LTPANVTLQLADTPVKISKREVEDVLIKVGELIFLVDLIILEIKHVRNP